MSGLEVAASVVGIAGAVVGIVAAMHQFARHSDPSDRNIIAVWFSLCTVLLIACIVVIAIFGWGSPLGPVAATLGAISIFVMILLMLDSLDGGDRK
ncbi:hypothetical protein [Nocardia sp. NPDC052566]|uniref:hypothetical protein n=1 Tax=Nocardia sp. NPDC052566 TaxID=3364330 RepID=UPI0037C8DD93